MSKAIRLLWIVLFAFLSFHFTSSATARNRDKTIYAFAVGTCLTDSVVYFSPISTIPNAAINRKTHFLTNRQLYSAQFTSFLDHTQASKQKYTCAIFFDCNKRSSLEKTYVKLRRHYNKAGMKLIEIPANEFAFSDISTEETEKTF